MKRRGHIALFVLVFIVAAGLMLQGLVRWALADEAAAKDFDKAAQRHAEALMLGEAVKNALHSHFEAGLFSQSLPVATLLDAALADISGGEIVRTAVPVLPSVAPATFHASFASYSDGATSTLNSTFNVLASSTLVRDVSLSENFRLPHLPAMLVRSGTTEIFTFEFARSTPSAINYRVTARLWQVPITDFEITAYATPISSTLPALSAAPNLGTNSLSNPSVRTGLFLSGLSNGAAAVSESAGLPSTQRALVAAAGSTWDYVWSTHFRMRFVETLPAFHAIALDAPPQTSDLPTGVTVDTGAGTISVAVSEVAASGLYLSDRAVGGGTIVLTQGSGGTSSPLQIFIEGSTSGAAVQLNLGSSLTRPVVIYLVRGNLNAPSGSRSLVGALLLGPTSTIHGGSPLPSQLTITGSFAASATNWPDLTNIVVNRSSSPVWRGLVPRTLIVQTRGAVQ